ncbi:MAG: hypothetical protein CUN56_07820 [Phototrophicales bacterium]|nr:MAG: hypothetical protein CUN56_07820 [Phototrophicales bacterium]RMG69725.1 MAG: hypothetical protein D6711_18935 [Chloroflexota bacterium]
MKRIKPVLLMFFTLCLAPATALTQSLTCSAIVQTALAAVDELCTDLGRNQACYGNISVSAVPREGVTDFTFEQTGDVIDVSDLQSMRLAPMDVENGTWGVAVMNLQANLPDTLPGQNVTFVLFGDVEIESAVQEGDDYTPMQAFYLRTGIGDAACEEAPESGLLVQTPEGVSEVAFNVNGVDVAMGSTVFFQAQPEDEMVVSTVEGSAVVQINGELHTAVAGTRLRWGINRDLRPESLPNLPEDYDPDRMQRLPVRILRRAIQIHEPLSSEQLDMLHHRLVNGEPPCGVDPLPDCERLPQRLGDHFRLTCIPDELLDRFPNADLPPCSSLSDRPPTHRLPPQVQATLTAVNLSPNAVRATLTSVNIQRPRIATMTAVNIPLADFAATATAHHAPHNNPPPPTRTPTHISPIAATLTAINLPPADVIATLTAAADHPTRTPTPYPSRTPTTPPPYTEPPLPTRTPTPYPSRTPTPTSNGPTSSN